MRASTEEISDLGMTTKEVARLLRMHPKTVEKMRGRGQGPPFIELGGRYYYPAHEYYAWLQQKLGTMRMSAAV